MHTSQLLHRGLRERERSLVEGALSDTDIYKIYAAALVHAYRGNGTLAVIDDWSGALVLAKEHPSERYYVLFLNMDMPTGPETARLDFEIRLSHTSEIVSSSAGRSNTIAMDVIYRDEDSALNLKFFDVQEASKMIYKAEAVLNKHIRARDQGSTASGLSILSGNWRRSNAKDVYNKSKFISAWVHGVSETSTKDHLPRRNLQFKTLSKDQPPARTRTTSSPNHRTRREQHSSSKPEPNVSLPPARVGSRSKGEDGKLNRGPGLKINIGDVQTVLEEGSQAIVESPVCASMRMQSSLQRSPDCDVHASATPNMRRSLPTRRPVPQPTRTLSRELTIGGRTVSVPELGAGALTVDSEVIGKGGFGKVLKGTWIDVDNGGRRTTVAIKSVYLHEPSFDVRNTRESKRFRYEAGIWSQLKHRNVLKFVGMADLPGMPACLISPFMKNGNVRSYLRNHQRNSRFPFFQGIADGIVYLHSQDVIHGDLKGANILVSDDKQALLCDFGLAYFSGSGADEKRSASSTILRAGSYQWMAYELLMSDQPGLIVSKASDIWAFAMVVIELLTTDLPFPGQRSSDVLLELKKKRRPRRPDMAECTDKLWDLVCRCWKDEPVDRPSAGEVSRAITELAKLASRKEHAHL